MTTVFIGIFANLFMCALLHFYVPGWNPGKQMLYLVHANEFMMAITHVGPPLRYYTTGKVPSSDDCVFPGVVLNVTQLIQPSALVMMAHVRWRVLRLSVAGGGAAADAPVRKYMLVLAAWVVLNSVAVAVNGHFESEPYLFINGMACVRRTTWQKALVLASTLFVLLYVVYCSARIIRILPTFSGQYDSNGQTREAISVLVALTTLLYVTQLPLTVWLEVTPSSGTTATDQGLAGLLGVLYFSHSMFSPIITITLKKRYRKLAKAMLRMKSPAKTLNLRRRRASISAEDLCNALAAQRKLKRASGSLLGNRLSSIVGTKRVCVQPRRSAPCPASKLNGRLRSELSSSS